MMQVAKKQLVRSSQHWYRRRLFSTPPPTNCDIVQGPSLLRTTTHRPRPSLLFLPGLRSLPFWTQCHDGDDDNNGETRIAYNDPQITQAVQHLEANVETIRNEYGTIAEQKQMKSDYQIDTEHTLHEGNWNWHSYMSKGTLQGHFGQHFPETTRILQTLRDSKLLFEGTPFGYCFFSTLHGQSSIGAHAAPMNLRLRVHLGLRVPTTAGKNSSTTTTTTSDDDRPLCGLRVGPLTRSWQNNKALVLDDAYDHQVWNETDEKRVLLLVDLWHPDVSMQEREDIVGLFQHAQKQGWWKNTS